MQMRLLTAFAALAFAACANTPVAPPALASARLGLVVTTLDGRELLAINPDQRFTPASNTKLFTTAAVLNTMRGLDKSDHAAAASLYEEVVGDGPPPNLVLYGRGDAALGDGPQCQKDCLAELADAVLDYGFKEIGDVIGDDTLFPDERWGGGWSWNNLETRSGTAISALTVNDNELALRVAPGASVGATAIAAFREGDDLYLLGNDAVTVESGATDLWIEHRPNTPTARLYGTIPLASPPQILAMGVDDPALLAAKRLRRLLIARKITVSGDPIARHRPVAMSDDPAKRLGATPPAPPEPFGTELARLAPAPFAADIPFTLKQSQNLHAELMLRRLGRVSGTGSAADGIAVINQMLLATGAARTDWDFSDGSGMSTYNRVTPRLVVRFLVWTTHQPWSETFRAALPVGGVDGTLGRRFKGTPLEGKVLAKTGSLSAVNALSGFMVTKSGRTLAFAAFVNDAPSELGSAVPALDEMLLKVAAEN